MPAEILAEGLRLRRGAAAFDFRLDTGAAVAVMGPAGAGKSQLLEVLAGEARTLSGAVQVRGEIVVAGVGGLTLRGNSQSLARRVCHKPAAAAEALSALGLWDVRRLPLVQLSPSHQAAAALVPIFAPGAGLLLVDGQFDALDPWVLGSAIEAARARLADGAVLVVATHRTDVAESLGAVLALRAQELRYFGDVDTLRNLARPAEITVETGDPDAVRGICAPYALRVEEVPGGLRLVAVGGQEVAARLLTEGYGAVRAVTLIRPTLAEALRTL